MKKHPKIIIILLNWNGKKDTLECISSLQKLNYPNFQILIIDNHSSDDSVEVFRKTHPEIPLLENKENLGFAGGNNPGIKWALDHHAEWILLLNNDTIVDPELLNEFLEASKEEPKAKILGAKILRYHTPNIIDHLGGMWNETKGEFESLFINEEDQPYLSMKKVDYVCGAALFMQACVPEKIGLLEPNYFLFWEESDYCYRARKEGFEIWTAPKAKVWHKVSSSFVGGKPHMHYFWWRSRLLWIERNLEQEEKDALYKNVIYPEIWKMARHFIVKSLFNFGKKRNEKLKRYKAGLAGVIDYLRNKFGNCPTWLIKK